MSQKMDAPLRQRLAKMQAADSTYVLSVFVRCSRPISDADATAMKETGANISSIVGDICTARGLPAQLHDLALLAFVQKIELDTQNLPSKSQ